MAGKCLAARSWSCIMMAVIRTCRLPTCPGHPRRMRSKLLHRLHLGYWERMHCSMLLPLGTRLIVDKARAAVRCVGFVEGHQGTWLGLEWDDVSRGHRDGIVGGRRYFTCRDSAPEARSFASSSFFKLLVWAPAPHQPSPKGMLCKAGGNLLNFQSVLHRTGCPQHACTYVMQI